MMSKRKPTQAYWSEQFDRARDLVDEFVGSHVDIEPEALAMFLIEAACNLQCLVNQDDEARRVIMDDIEEFFREGPLPRPDASDDYPEN